MQAQMIPMLISVVDQSIMSKLSNVWLSEVANVTKARKRRILTMVTLQDMSVTKVLTSPALLQSATHNVPTKNIKATPIFFFQ